MDVPGSFLEVHLAPSDPLQLPGAPQCKHREAIDELLESALHDAEKIRELRRMIAYAEDRLRAKWLDALS